MLTDNTKLIGEDLAILQHEKGNPCISIIVPTHRLSPERTTDRLPVERAIEKAKEKVQLQYTDEQAGILIKAIDELHRQIDYNHNQEGVGLFVSPHLKLMISFPFLVQEKVIVADRFETRDVLYKVNYSQPYYVLQITEQKITLFNGELKKLSEVEDVNFPIEWEDDYEYNPPGRASSYTGEAALQGFEQDKPALEEIRLSAVFRNADELLSHYLLEAIPLVLCGDKKHTAYFKMNSRHNERIIATIFGNYTHATEKELGDIVWPEVKAYLDGNGIKQLELLKEKSGEGLVETGIQNVWQAVKEGRGLELLVEKDYRVPGFTDDNGYALYLTPPSAAHKILKDAVNELIEEVLAKKGKVIFLENGTLKDHQSIALLTRYVL